MDSFILDITWEGGGLPALVGPFKDRDEATGWARLNIPNGSFEVRPLSYPYMQVDGHDVHISLR